MQAASVEFALEVGAAPLAEGTNPDLAFENGFWVLGAVQIASQIAISQNIDVQMPLVLYLNNG